MKPTTVAGDRASLAFGIGLTWLLVPAVSAVLAVAAAWPLGLFLGGDVRSAFIRAFCVIAAFAAVWAARTTRSLIGAHQARGDRFRAPWPQDARAGALVMDGVLDRRRQPTERCTACGDSLAALRSGERGGRGFMLQDPALVYLVVRSDRAAHMTLYDRDERAVARLDAAPGGQPLRLRLGAGGYRVEIERPQSERLDRVDVRAWWVAVADDGANT